MNKAEQKRSQYLMIVKELPYRLYTLKEVAYLLRISGETFKNKFRYKVISPMVSRWGKEFYLDRDIEKAYKYMFEGISAVRKEKKTRVKGGKYGKIEVEDKGDADGGSGDGLPPEEGTPDS